MGRKDGVFALVRVVNKQAYACIQIEEKRTNPVEVSDEMQRSKRIFHMVVPQERY
jgi:hypothetical protein